MTYKYDLRLTLRNALEKKYIFKQYHVKGVVFPNPVVSGDRLFMVDDKNDYFFETEPVVVNQSPEPNPKSMIFVETNTFEEKLSRIETLLEQYDFEEF